MKRSLTTNERVDKLMSRDEPSFLGHSELTKIDIALCLNWYSQHRDKEASHKYLTEYCKTEGIIATAEQITSQPSTLGFVCRMISRGAVLDKKSRQWTVKRLHNMSTSTVRDALFDEKKELPVATPKPATIQDRLKEKSSKCIGDLEGAVDNFILSDFKKAPNTLEVMRNHDIKGAHGPNIVNFFKKWRDEFRVAIAGKDEQVNEEYSNYTLPQMKKMESFYDQIISDALKVMGDSLASREPRAKKIKSPEKQVKSLKYCPEDTTLKIKSIPPTRMIGSGSVFIYNRKNRILSHYVADDAAGLGIKGSSFMNFSKSKSRCKKLRKPDEILPQIVSGGKVFLKNIMNTLTTKDSNITGRCNGETILLRVVE